MAILWFISWEGRHGAVPHGEEPAEAAVGLSRLLLSPG